MAKALSNDLRQRVIEGIERGLSCRQAAERFGVSASSAIRWRDRLKKQGNVAAKRQGGDRKSGRIEAEAAFLLARSPRHRISRASRFRRSCRRAASAPASGRSGASSTGGHHI